MQHAATRTTNLPEPQRSELDQLRQHCLWALGTLAGLQLVTMPSSQIAALPIIRGILSDREERPEVRAAATWALVAMHRLGDPTIQGLLKFSVSQPEPEICSVASDALGGVPLLPSPPPGD